MEKGRHGMSDRYRVDRTIGGGYSVRQTDLVEDAAIGAAKITGAIIGAGIGGIGSLVKNNRDRKLNKAVDDMFDAAEREDFDSLLRMATEFSQKNRSESVGPALLSIALAGKDQFGEAHAAVERALQLGFDASEAIDLRINIYRRKGDMAGLLKESSTLAQSRDRQWEGCILRAQSLMQIGDFDLALADANRAISLSPDEFGYYVRGDIHREQGRVAEAVEDYSRAIRLNPKDPDYFERRASAYDRLEKPDEASADRAAAQRMASHAQASARTMDAVNFIVFLRESGIRLQPTPSGGLTSSGGLDVVGGRGISQEAKAKLNDLTAELLDLLRPRNDRGAAMILLAYMRANKVELESPSPGVVRVTRGLNRLSRETEAELKRLAPEVAELLAE